MEKKNERSRYGIFMYTITFKASVFLMEHMWLYYLLNYTWGIITTVGGWIAYAFVRVFLHKKISEKGKFGPCLYLKFGHNWGGLELGTNFFVADYMGDIWTHHTKCHECGHTFQNAIWGPFAIFLIFIPSVYRYWYDVYCSKHGIFLSDEWYDTAWFEGEATDSGTFYYENYLSEKNN